MATVVLQFYITYITFKTIYLPDISVSSSGGGGGGKSSIGGGGGKLKMLRLLFCFSFSIIEPRVL